MNAESNRNGFWEPCEPGSLQAYGRRSKLRRRSQAVARAASAAVVLLLVGVGSWAVIRNSGFEEYHCGGISCSEVRANGDAFARGRVSDPLAKRMKIHLSKCPNCGELMKEMQVSSVDPSVAEGYCEHCHPRETVLAGVPQPAAEATFPLVLGSSP